MSVEFHETQYGRAFFEHQLPTLLKTLQRIADNEEKINQNTAELLKSAKPKRLAEDKRIVYLCYEENSTELYNDAGNINRVFLTEDHDEAIRWTELSRQSAKDNDYRALNAEDENVFEADISIGKNASLWVYKAGNEKSRSYYGIYVECFDLNEPQSLNEIF